MWGNDSVLIRAQPLDPDAFAPFGQVLQHRPGDLARRNFAAELSSDRHHARPNLRVQRTQPTPLPLTATFIERHRHSSQMFAPLDGGRFLVAVWPSDEKGDPRLDQGQAFLARGDQAVNYNRDVWHHGFVAVEKAGAFLMLRWEDGSPRDEEFLSLTDPIRIEA
jgi:ureidoglycolate lyase